MDVIAVKGSIIRCKSDNCQTNITVLKDTVITYDAVYEVFKLADLATSLQYKTISVDEFVSISGNTRLAVDSENASPAEE